jgi:hypothetical protein
MRRRINWPFLAFVLAWFALFLGVAALRQCDGGAPRPTELIPAGPQGGDR